MRITRPLAVGATCALGLALTLGSTPAFADYGPQAGDIVGVGSDTVQNIGNFLTDGDTVGDAGYNNAGNVNRFVSVDATADANDRAVYAKGGASPLKTTAILRAGTSPVQRPNGSGAGINALLADTAATETINFVRMSRFPKTTEQTTAVNNGWGGLHAVKVATDDLVMAANGASTNAVAVTGADLVNIYKCTTTDWNTLNPAAPVGSTIIPLIPQSGSGTGDSFRADLATFNGGTAVTLGACVQTVEENDPSSITGLGATAANAIAPFSSGRKKLFDNGYFKDPATAFPGGAALTSGLQLLYGGQTAGSCAAPVLNQSVAYCNTRGLFVVWRQNDSTITTPWQPGSTRNWVKTLFWTGTTTKPFVQTSGGQALIAQAGVTPTYVDCGVLTGSTTTC